jgi:DNA-directed RNA polymerase subunit M/transcription elongation factor TFIIS
MIKGTSRYLCECGVSLQVLTETDKARIAEEIRLYVSCPKCKEKQVIYAHHITKIAIELPAKAQN